MFGLNLAVSGGGLGFWYFLHTTPNDDLDLFQVDVTLVKPGKYYFPLEAFFFFLLLLMDVKC